MSLCSIMRFPYYSNPVSDAVLNCEDGFNHQAQDVVDLGRGIHTYIYIYMSYSLTFLKGGLEQGSIIGLIQGDTRS